MPEPALVDVVDLSAAKQTGKHAIDGQAEVRIATSEREGIRLDREILVEEPVLFLRAACQLSKTCFCLRLNL